MTRYFHLYADGKRIREISKEEYIRISRGWRESGRPRRLMAVTKTGIWVERGNNGIWIPFDQLLEVLRICGVIKDEGYS